VAKLANPDLPANSCLAEMCMITDIILMSSLGYWRQRSFTGTCRFLWRWQKWG